MRRGERHLTFVLLVILCAVVTRAIAFTPLSVTKRLCASQKASTPITMSSKILRGVCHCGQVQWRARGVGAWRVGSEEVRRTTAAAQAPLVNIDGLELEKGALRSTPLQSGSVLQWCVECRGRVAVQDADGGSIALFAGALPDEAQTPAELLTDQQSSVAGWWPTDGDQAEAARQDAARAEHTEWEFGCSCGAVRAVVSRAPDQLQHCHCRQCRLTHGAPVVTWTPLRHREVRWEGTALELKRTTSGGSRHGCTECGTTLSIQYDSQPNTVWLAAGGFRAHAFPTPLKRVLHICCSWRAPWWPASPEELRTGIPFAG